MNLFNDISNTSEASYTSRFDYDGSGNVIYTGIAKPGTLSSAAAWSIRRYTYSSGNVTVVEHADANTLMDNIWDNRASLSYA